MKPNLKKFRLLSAIPFNYFADEFLLKILLDVWRLLLAMNTYKAILSFLGCFVFLGSVCNAQIKAFLPPPVLKWNTLEQALLDAPKSDKMIMLAFHGNECPFSKKMMDDVYSKPDIQHLINQYFIPVEIMLDENKTMMYNGYEIEAQKLAKIFKVEGTPTLAFLNDEGDLIAIQPGYLSPKLFAKLMEYVGEGFYATMSFSEFSEKKMKERK